jgi:hypothetical protein
MWENKGEVLDGLLSSFTNPTQEVELGADWDRDVAAHNIPVDVGLIGKDIKTIVTHPKEAYEAATGLLGGAWRTGLEKVMPEAVMDALGKVDEYVGYDSESDKAMASEAWQDFVATHGGLEEVQKYGNEHPVYLAAELSGLGFLARQVSKMVAPAVVKAMEATEMGVPMENVVNKYTKNLTPSGQGLLADQKFQMADISTHHGTPDGATYRYFNFNKIGSGMGVQKEAWGMYVSGQPETGKFFAGRYDPRLKDAYDHKLTKYLSPIERFVWSQASAGKRPVTVLKELKDKYPDKKHKAEIDKVMKEFDGMHDKAMNQLYEVALDEDAVKGFLIREAPMTQQPLKVQALAKEHGFPSTTTGKELYKYLAEDFATQIGGEGARKMASEYLASKGIHGMQYMDDITPTPFDISPEGVLTAQTPPNYSYVLFDDTTHKITHRQGKPIGDVELINPKYGLPRIVDQRLIKEGLLDPDLLPYHVSDVPMIGATDSFYNLAEFHGYPWIGTMSDTSRVGLLEALGVRMRGGQGYMMDDLNWKEGRVWEMGEGARSGLLNALIEARKLNPDKPALLLPYSLKPTSIDFTHPVTETILASAVKNLTKKQLRELDKLIRTKSIDRETGKNINQKFKGVLHDDALEGTTGAERKAIANIIDVNFRHIDGVLSYPEARLLNVDPVQLNKQPLTFQNIAEIAKDPVGMTASHDSYGYSVLGEPVGRLAEDNIHLLDLLPKAKKASGEPLTLENLSDADYRKLTMQQNYGLLTEEILRKLDDQGKLYGGLLK